MGDQFYWESEMRHGGDGAATRIRCLIYERTNPDPIASCVDVDIAEKVVSTLNKAHREGWL